jgi:hypothetical protein
LKITDNQPTITICNSQSTFNQIRSAVTTIGDDQSSSSSMMPITSIPRISPPIDIEQQQQLSTQSNRLKDPKADFDIFIDQQLQATLQKHLRSHSLSSSTMNHENIQQQQRKTKIATLTKSETGKLMDESDFTKQVCNLEQYEKQVSRNHD